MWSSPSLRCYRWPPSLPKASGAKVPKSSRKLAPVSTATEPTEAREPHRPLSGKNLTMEQVNRIVGEGVANTNMAGWKDVLSAPDLAAVIDYVFGLQKLRGSQREALDPDRPWLRHAGRKLFFDAGRIAPCGSCHEFDGLGLGVARRFESAPSVTAATLRTLKSEKVRRVQPAAQQQFIGIAATSKAGLPRWYDLSAQLPVLRTHEVPAEDTGPESSWSHGDVVGSYNDAELEKVFEFLGEALASPGN